MHPPADVPERGWSVQKQGQVGLGVSHVCMERVLRKVTEDKWPLEQTQHWDIWDTHVYSVANFTTVFTHDERVWGVSS